MLKLIIAVSLISLGLAQKGGEIVVTKLDLSNKGLTSLNDYDFSKYLLLEEIDLSNNDLEHIKEKTFIKNTKLLKINLSGNKNLEFPQYSTLLISNIEELNLSNCGIKKLPQHVFEGLRYLKTIDISGNPLQKKGLDITSLNTIEAFQKIILPSENKQLIKDLCENFNITIEINNKNNKIPSVRCTDYTTATEKDSQEEESKEQNESGENGDKPNVEISIAENLSIDAPKLNSESKVKPEEKNEAVPVEPNSNADPQTPVVAQKASVDDAKPEKPKNDDKVETPKEDKEEVVPIAAKPKLEPRENNDENSENQNLPELTNNKPEPQTKDENPKPGDDSKSINVKSDDANIQTPEMKVAAAQDLPESVDKPHLEPRTDENDNPDQKSIKGDASKQASQDSSLTNLKFSAGAQSNLPISNSDATKSDTQKTDDKKTEDDKKDDTIKPQAGSNPIDEPAKPKEVESNVNVILQTNKSEKMQTDTGVGVGVESEKVGEVSTEASNTGSTILIVLVIAVVVAGIAAFGYKFYKNRSSRNAEPVERELKEIVVGNKVNRPESTQDVIEQEPLMNHTKKENGDVKINSSTGETIGKSLNAHVGPVNTLNSTGPYMPTTTTFKPESTNDAKM